MPTCGGDASILARLTRRYARPPRSLKATPMTRNSRIENLIARMTVEEKVGQLGCFADAVRPFAGHQPRSERAWCG